jgi:hypothetical protein
MHQSTQTIKQMPARNNTFVNNTFVNNTFVIRVNGCTELKRYIQDTRALVHEVRAELDDDLKQPKAVVPSTPRHEMTALKHACFIRDKVRCQTSAFAVAESAIHEALAQLEIIRKMLVTNKQTKRTMVRAIQKTIANMRAHISSLEGTIEPTAAKPIQQLQQIKEATKQHHRTVSHGLLHHANHILIAMRLKHILAYKLAAQDAIGEIIHHAEKCRAFISKRNHLALIEHCVSEWWNETHPDTTPSSHYVSVHDSGKNDRFNAANPFEFCAAPPIQIVIKTNDRNHNILFNDALDQELADTIFTEEAIESFVQ